MVADVLRIRCSFVSRVPSLQWMRSGGHSCETRIFSLSVLPLLSLAIGPFPRLPYCSLSALLLLALLLIGQAFPQQSLCILTSGHLPLHMNLMITVQSSTPWVDLQHCPSGTPVGGPQSGAQSIWSITLAHLEPGPSVFLLHQVVLKQRSVSSGSVWAEGQALLVRHSGPHVCSLYMPSELQTIFHCLPQWVKHRLDLMTNPGGQLWPYKHLMSPTYRLSVSLRAQEHVRSFFFESEATLL